MKAIEGEMAQNNGGRGAGVNRDRVVTLSASHHDSDIAGAAVNGDRRGDRDGEKVAAADAVDLGDVAFIDRALKGKARGGLKAIVAVISGRGNPQCQLRLSGI